MLGWSNGLRHQFCTLAGNLCEFESHT